MASADFVNIMFAYAVSFAMLAPTRKSKLAYLASAVLAALSIALTLRRGWWGADMAVMVMLLGVVEVAKRKHVVMVGALVLSLAASGIAALGCICGLA